MKKLFLCLLLFFVFTVDAFSQKYVDEESTFMERLYVGGNFGLQIGNVTQIEVSPAVGYMFNNKFSAGVGVVYQYFKANIRSASQPPQVYEISTSIYGGKVFGRYNITDFLFAYTEYENVNLDVVDFNTREIQRGWVPGMFVGGGYFQPIGRRAGVNLMLLYNLLYDPLKSPYNNAFVLRLGFSL